MAGFLVAVCKTCLRVANQTGVKEGVTAPSPAGQGKRPGGIGQAGANRYALYLCLLDAGQRVAAADR